MPGMMHSNLAQVWFHSSGSQAENTLTLTQKVIFDYMTKQRPQATKLCPLIEIMMLTFKIFQNK